MTKHIKLSLQFIAILFCSMTLSQAAFSAGKNAESLDRIIAVVDDSAITQSELNQAMASAKHQLMGSGTPIPAQDVLRKQVLDQLINRKLQFELAERGGVKIADADVDKAIGTVAAGHKVTVDELYQKITAQGLNIKNYRKEIHDELVLNAVQQQAVGGKITVTPEEVNALMRSKSWQNYNEKEYHLEDILIALPENPTPQQITETKKRAQELFAKLRKGLDFQSAAAAESGGSNALQGGDLGWRKMQEVPSAFASELMNVKANDVFGPIQTSNGFHLVRLMGVRDIAGQPKADLTKQQAQRVVFQRKFEEAVQAWLSKTRAEAFINLHPETQKWPINA